MTTYYLEVFFINGKSLKTAHMSEEETEDLYLVCIRDKNTKEVRLFKCETTIETTMIKRHPFLGAL